MYSYIKFHGGLISWYSKGDTPAGTHLPTRILKILEMGELLL